MGKPIHILHPERAVEAHALARLLDALQVCLWTKQYAGWITGDDVRQDKDDRHDDKERRDHLHEAS
jgi:hypothetical protein